MVDTVVTLSNGLVGFALIGLFLLFRRGKKTTPQQTRAEEQAQKNSEALPPKTGGDAETKPTAPERPVRFASLGELASAIGAKHLILFNQYGIPIESYNVREGRGISVPLAEFVSTMRKLSPDFDSIVSGNGRKIILSSIEKVGDIEVFALVVGDSEMKVKADEAREFLKAYLSESLGRRK
jgi:hypothetical protein